MTDNAIVSADRLVSTLRDTDPTDRNACVTIAKAEKWFKSELRANEYPEALIEKLVYDCHEVAKHERHLKGEYPELFDSCNEARA